MPQTREDHCLQTKLAGILICREQVFLNGYIHAEVLIHRAVYRAHAPLSENLDYAITFMK